MFSFPSTSHTAFAKREVKPLLFASILGALAGCCGHVVTFDRAFQNSLALHLAASNWHLAPDPQYAHATELILLCGVTLTVLYAAPAIARGLRSLRLGVASGLRVVPFCAAAVVSFLPIHSLWLMVTAFGVVVTVGYLLALAAFLVASQARTTSRVRSSDDPITSWDEDRLHRSAIVDVLVAKLLCARAPAIALYGEYGVGKTSILNLLRLSLTRRAIVVSFSAWLPGSSESLVGRLLADITTQCTRRFSVPSLRLNTRRIAHAIARHYGVLQWIGDLYLPSTQNDDVERLKNALGRLPQRVVVLLDDLDRMDTTELKTLLKVIRGTSGLPNLSFVCAVSRAFLEKTAAQNVGGDGGVYCEKFFPVAVNVPPLDSQQMKEDAIDRLGEEFRIAGWFSSAEEKEDYQKKLAEAWPCVGAYLHNLRQITLFANDIGVVASLIKRELNPIDLTMLTALQRFSPAVYLMVSENCELLTGGEGLLRGGRYMPEEKTKAERLKLRQRIFDSPRGEEAMVVIDNLFPEFKADVVNNMLLRRPRSEEDGATKTRISYAGVFPAYFRLELPDSIFGSVEMERLIATAEKCQSQAECSALITKTLADLPKGGLKRDDFLDKLSERMKTVEPEVAQRIVAALMVNAHLLTYDMMYVFAEAGHVLRAVLAVAQRLSKGRVKFLSECIEKATDDTMALRIFVNLAGEHEGGGLGVEVKDLYPTFIGRMRRQFGENAGTHTDLSTADALAFGFWGADAAALAKYSVTPDPKDRQTQYSFWRRYIGSDRVRLGQVFARFMLPVAIYQTDPTPFVERLISTDELRSLFKGLPNDDAGIVDAEAKRGLKLLERYLNGEFKHGANPDMFREEPSAGEGAHA